MRGSRLLAVDLIAAAVMPFIAVWIYELANLIVLSLEGCSATLTVAGVLPSGVAGVSVGTIPPWTKLVQIGVSLGLILPVVFAVSKERLHLAKALAVTSVAVYLASAYWEALSTLTSVSMAAHTAIFVTGTGALSLALLWGTGRPRAQPRSLPSLPA